MTNWFVFDHIQTNSGIPSGTIWKEVPLKKIIKYCPKNYQNYTFGKKCTGKDKFLCSYYFQVVPCIIVSRRGTVVDIVYVLVLAIVTTVTWKRTRNYSTEYFISDYMSMVNIFLKFSFNIYVHPTTKRLK